MATFQDHIHVFQVGRPFVTREEERHLLQTGTQRYGLALPAARAAIMDAAASDRFALQSAVDESVRSYLESVAGRSRRISPAQFEQATELYRARARGAVGAGEAASRVKAVVEQAGLTPRPSGLLWRTTDWYQQIPAPPPAPVPTLAAIGPGAQAPASMAIDPMPVIEAWRQGVVGGSVEAILATYSPLALLLATGSMEPRTGPDQLRGYFEGLAARANFTVAFGPVLDSKGSDPVAVSGLYTFSWSDQAGNPVSAPARYTFVVGTTAPEAGPRRVAILQHHSSAVPGVRGGFSV